MTKRRIVRSAVSVFLSLALVLSGIMPGTPLIKTVQAAETINITPEKTAEQDVSRTGTGQMSITLKIKAEITPTVTLEGWTYGSTANSPALGAGSNPGNGTVTYEYKVKDADDNTYSSTVPTAQGDYTIRATVAETSDYKSGTATADFTIGPETQSMTITLFIHGHDFEYSKDGAKITAICKGDGDCDYKTTPVTLTLVAPAKKVDTDSGSAEATIDGLTAFNEATGLDITAGNIEYYNGTTKLAAAPAKKGDYTAKLTVGTGANTMSLN